MSVVIEWLIPKWKGVQEPVVRSRIRKGGDLVEGMEVMVTYKRCHHKARIVSLKRLQRRAPLIKTKPAVRAGTKTRPARIARDGEAKTQPAQLARDGAAKTQPARLARDGATKTHPGPIARDGAAKTQPGPLARDGAAKTQPIRLVPAAATTHQVPSAELPGPLARDGAAKTQPGPLARDGAAKTQPIRLVPAAAKTHQVPSAETLDSDTDDEFDFPTYFEDAPETPSPAPLIRSPTPPHQEPRYPVLSIQSPVRPPAPLIQSLTSHQAPRFFYPSPSIQLPAQRSPSILSLTPQQAPRFFYPSPSIQPPAQPAPSINSPTPHPPQRFFSPAHHPAPLVRPAARELFPHQQVLHHHQLPAPQPIYPPLHDVVQKLISSNELLINSHHRMEAEMTEMRKLMNGYVDNVGKSSPMYKATDGDDVFIGSDTDSCKIKKELYDGIYYKCKGPKDLIIKLMDRIIPKEVLARSNFHGGEVFNGKLAQKEVMRTKPEFRALVAQAELQFPGCNASAIFQKELRNAVNNRCRRVAFQLHHGR